MWYKGVATSADARVSKSQCRDSLFSTLKVTLLCDSLVCGSLTGARWWSVNKSQGMGDEGQVPSKDRMKEEGHKCIVLDAMQSMETGRRASWRSSLAVEPGVYDA